jgi:hypothetical protein
MDHVKSVLVDFGASSNHAILGIQIGDASQPLLKLDEGHEASNARFMVYYSMTVVCSY